MNPFKPADTNSAKNKHYGNAGTENANVAANEIWLLISWQGLELKRFKTEGEKEIEMFKNNERKWQREEGTEEAGEELLSHEQQRRTQKKIMLFIKK